MPSEGLLHFSFMINSQVYMRDEEGPLGLDQLVGAALIPDMAFRLQEINIKQVKFSISAAI